MSPNIESAEGPPLWWRREFLESQSAQANFFWFDSVCIPFVEQEDRIEVGLLGPYGGAFDMAHDADWGATQRAWQKFHREAKKEVLVRLPPESHFSHARLANQSALQWLGATLHFEDFNQSISIREGATASEGFERRRRRDIRRAAELGISIESANLEDAFLLIQKNRLSRGFPLNTGIEKLIALETRCPGTLTGLIAHSPSDHAASAIVFRVSNRISYVSMWGRNVDSPVGTEGLTALAAHLIDLSRNDGASILCLGTSTSSGRVDEGLFAYKSGLGAKAEGKPTFRLSRPRPPFVV